MVCDHSCMAHLTRLTGIQRASIATFLTLAGVVGMEVGHFSSGDTPIVAVSYFAIGSDASRAVATA